MGMVTWTPLTVPEMVVNSVVTFFQTGVPFLRTRASAVFSVEQTTVPKVSTAHVVITAEPPGVPRARAQIW